jgi:nitroreductase
MALHPLLAQRTSTRAFDPSHEVDDVTLVALLDAARWAPSSMNRQPWRFAVARRGTGCRWVRPTTTSASPWLS